MPIDYSTFRKFAKLSPFEQKNELIALATDNSSKTMLNAGRGNPNWIVTEPREAFFLLGTFGLQEAARYFADEPGIGGLPEQEGIAERFDAFLQMRHVMPGSALLRGAVSYVRRTLGISADEFVWEITRGVIGGDYPTPDRILRVSEQVLVDYLVATMCNGDPVPGGVDLFATEGSTASIPYVFNTLRENFLLNRGDRIAIAVPIFTPYIEMPPLNDYELVSVDLNASEEMGWQYPDKELEKLLDPAIKALFLVNPSNPPSVKMAPDRMARLVDIVQNHRQDLMILTDDVYGTFADDFVSLFSSCPRNTILAYSFSKHYGATGWRVAVAGVARDNIFDEKLANLPKAQLDALAKRYMSVTLDPASFRFIDRMVADSRAVALNHTAGLSTPQQVQMVLFALQYLTDRDRKIRNTVTSIVRGRFGQLMKGLGFKLDTDPNSAGYYYTLDLIQLAEKLHGKAFATWLANAHQGEFVFRLAEETGVVLLPALGFDVFVPAARVSLANLDHNMYFRIGQATRKVLDEYYSEYPERTVV
jgi:aspartate 4-decarboxylase